MSLLNSLSLQKQFYLSHLQYLPVLKKINRQQYQLVGFLSRKKLDIWMSDLQRCEQSYQEIPKSLLLTDRVPEDLLLLINEGVCPPVLSTTGELLAGQNKLPSISKDLLKVLLTFRRQLLEKQKNKSSVPQHSQVKKTDGRLLFLEKTSQPGNDKDLSSFGSSSATNNSPNPQLRLTELQQGNVAENLEEPSHPSENDKKYGKNWLGQAILATLPWPMFAVNLQGKSLFYNEVFAEKIIRHKKIRNSLLQAEAYLQQIHQDLVLRQLEKKDGPQKDGITYLPDLNSYMYILDLTTESGQKYGYLYFFLFEKEISIDQAFARSTSSSFNLTKIINNLERNLIDVALRNNQNNISQTARNLSLRRSTLQHKMKNLFPVDALAKKNKDASAIAQVGGEKQASVKIQKHSRPPKKIENLSMSTGSISKENQLLMPQENELGERKKKKKAKKR